MQLQRKLNIKGTEPDGELLLRYREGEEEAANLLISRYQKKLYRHIMGIVGYHYDIAEDIYQDVWYDVFRIPNAKLPKDWGKGIGPWLFKIASNKAKRWFRVSIRYQYVPMDHLPDIPVDDPGLSRVALDEQLGMLPEKLGMLPAKKKQVLISVYYKGMKFKEIALMMKEPISTVHRWKNDAIEQLNGMYDTTDD